jgi:hypothetical protein
MLSGRFLEDAYIYHPLVLTIYIKWIQVCGSARGSVRQCAAVLAVCDSTRQCAAVYGSDAVVCGNEFTGIYYI